MFEIGVLGSIACDTIFSIDHIPVEGERVFGKQLGEYIGGMAANQAIEAARYTNHVRLIGKIGLDEEGKKIIKQCNKRGVNTDFIRRSREHSTGSTNMYLVPTDYFSIVSQGANWEIGRDDVLKAVESMDTGILLISLEINPEAVLTALESGKEKGIETFLIPSPAENCTLAMYEAADSMILNKREAAMLLDLKIKDITDALEKLPAVIGKKMKILLTMGGEGAVLLDGKNVFVSKAIDVDAVDTIGAGDALAGAFAGSLANGFPPQKALSIGCIAGGLAAANIGSQTSAHSMQDVLTLYQTHYYS